MTGFLGHRLYHQPQLDVFTFAPQTIKAPFAARIEDTRTTEDLRKAAARREVAPVLMIDPAVNQKIDKALQQALAQGNRLRQIVGSFPFAETSVLSTSTQLYLRNSSESEWQGVLAIVNTGQEAIDKSKKYSIQPSKNATEATAVRELQAYRFRSSPQNFQILINTTSQARQRYAQAIAKYSELVASKSGTLYEISLFNLSDVEWKKTQKEILNSSERILTQGIPPGLPSSILQQAVSIQLELIPKTADTIATQVLLSV